MGNEARYASNFIQNRKMVPHLITNGDIQFFLEKNTQTVENDILRRLWKRVTLDYIFLCFLILTPVASKIDHGKNKIPQIEHSSEDRT